MPICLPPFLLCKHRTETYRSSHHNFTHPPLDINTLSNLTMPSNTHSHTVLTKHDSNLRSYPRIIAPPQWLKRFYQLLYSQVNSKCSGVPMNYLVFKLKYRTCEYKGYHKISQLNLLSLHHVTNITCGMLTATETGTTLEHAPLVVVIFDGVSRLTEAK